MVIPKPLYGSWMNHYTSLVIKKQLYGSRMNQYTSVNWREQTCSSGINQNFIYLKHNHFKLTDKS